MKTERIQTRSWFDVLKPDNIEAVGTELLRRFYHEPHLLLVYDNPACSDIETRPDEHLRSFHVTDADNHGERDLSLHFNSRRVYLNTREAWFVIFDGGKVTFRRHREGDDHDFRIVISSYNLREEQS